MALIKECPSCGEKNPPDEPLCLSCLASLDGVDEKEDTPAEEPQSRSWTESRICPVPDCGAENPPGAERCRYCNAPLEGARLTPEDADQNPAASTPRMEWPWGTLQIGERFPVGRNEEFCPEHHLRFDAYDNVSRYHAELRFDGTATTLTDLGTTNGTYVNERPLTPHVAEPLCDGDTVRFAADLTARFRC